MAKILFTLVFSCCFFLFSNAQEISFNLYFDIDVYTLNADQQRLLSSKIELLDRQKNYEIELEGSADYLGEKEANQVLSENRAESIIEFITAKYAGRFFRIRYSGIGEQTKDESYKEGIRGIQEHRRTRVIIKEKYTPPPTATKVEPASEPPPKPKIAEVVPATPKEKSKEAFIKKINTLAIGDKLVLQNLQFIPGRHILRDSSIPTIKLLLEILQQNEALEIEIHGHVCCGDGIGGRDGFDLDTQGYNLSKMRAKNVHDYLVKNGIDKKRLSHRGFAFDQPLHYPERSLEDKDANRRVEIKIIKN